MRRVGVAGPSLVRRSTGPRWSATFAAYSSNPLTGAVASLSLLGTIAATVPQQPPTTHWVICGFAAWADSKARRQERDAERLLGDHDSNRPRDRSQDGRVGAGIDRAGWKKPRCRWLGSRRHDDWVATPRL
jgi:hypothetical protein